MIRDNGTVVNVVAPENTYGGPVNGWAALLAADAAEKAVAACTETAQAILADMTAVAGVAPEAPEAPEENAGDISAEEARDYMEASKLAAMSDKEDGSSWDDLQSRCIYPPTCQQAEFALVIRDILDGRRKMDDVPEEMRRDSQAGFWRQLTQAADLDRKSWQIAQPGTIIEFINTQTRYSEFAESCAAVMWVFANPERARRMLPMGGDFGTATEVVAFMRTPVAEGFLVDRIMMPEQPMVLGGPEKILKSTLAIDLTVSLATGTPFLGEFAVPTAQKVLLISGEAGPRMIIKTLQAALRARGLSETDMQDKVWVDLELPTLTDPESLIKLDKLIRAAEPGVVILDPLYLAMQKPGDTRFNAKDMNQAGPVLAAFCAVVKKHGATPVILHHVVKSAGKDFKPCKLVDLADATMNRFAGQWVILSPRKEYVPESHQHSLWMSVGGRAVEDWLFGVDVAMTYPSASGTPGSFDWQITVSRQAEANQAAAAAEAREKQEFARARDEKAQMAKAARRQEQEKEDSRTVYYAAEPGLWRTTAVLKELTGLKPATIIKILSRMEHRGAVEQRPTSDNKSVEWRRRRPGEPVPDLRYTGLTSRVGAADANPPPQIVEKWAPDAEAAIAAGAGQGTAVMDERRAVLEAERTLAWRAELAARAEAAGDPGTPAEASGEAAEASPVVAERTGAVEAVAVPAEDAVVPAVMPGGAVEGTRADVPPASPVAQETHDAAILEVIRTRGGATTREIIDGTGIHQRTVQRRLARLGDLGVVEEQPGVGPRAATWRMTNHGPDAAESECMHV